MQRLNSFDQRTFGNPKEAAWLSLDEIPTLARPGRMRTSNGVYLDDSWKLKSVFVNSAGRFGEAH